MTVGKAVRPAGASCPPWNIKARAINKYLLKRTEYLNSPRRSYCSKRQSPAILPVCIPCLRTIIVIFMLIVQPLTRLVSIALSMSNNNATDAPAATATDSTKLPRIDSITPVASTNWLALQTLDYTDQDGKARKWDVATRTTKQARDKADAVVIVPLLRKKGSTKVETLLVEQYRPPVDRVTVEFPAGLIDKGETPEDAALRELREETGFVGEKCKVVPQVSPQVCMSPGLTDESLHCVLVEVDLDNPYNHGTPKPQLDDGEHVTVKRVDLREGMKRVLDEGEGMPIMGLYLFALGLDIGMGIANDSVDEKEE